MLKPSMQELMKKVNNRYLLVNLTAQRARDIASEAEEDGAVLHDKPVKLALDEIAAGVISYCPHANNTGSASECACGACESAETGETVDSESGEDE